MDGGFADYLEELVAAMAGRLAGATVEAVDIAQLHQEQFADRPLTWATAAGGALERMGLGDCVCPVDGVAKFLINEAGLRLGRERGDKPGPARIGPPRPDEVMGEQWFPLLYQPRHSSLRSSNDP
jgi:hypothetical protein